MSSDSCTYVPFMELSAVYKYGDSFEKTSNKLWIQLWKKLAVVSTHENIQCWNIFVGVDFCYQRNMSDLDFRHDYGHVWIIEHFPRVWDYIVGTSPVIHISNSKIGISDGK